MRQSRLSGTFLQPGVRLLAWDDSQWDRELGAMQAIGLDLVILQWTADDRAPVPEATVDRLMRHADARGMRVFLGLASHSEWWRRPSHVYAPLRGTTIRVAEDLARRWGGSPALAGWYLPLEMDNLRWCTGGARRRLVGEFLEPVLTRLRNLETRRPVLLSPFFFPLLPRCAFRSWWKATLAQVPFDVVALQDGVGCRRASPEQAAAWLADLASVCEGSDTQVWGNVEIFRQVEGWPRKLWSFHAEAAPMDGVARQMDALAAVAERLICFEFPTYMSPYGDPAARHLYQGYAERLATAPFPA